MICPYCHQEIPQGSDRCPHCGRSIVQKPIEEEPRLSRGMKVFIAVGGALLAAFTIYNAVSHFGDPEYTRTPSYLEPDSTLIEKLAEPHRPRLRRYGCRRLHRAAGEGGGQEGV